MCLQIRIEFFNHLFRVVGPCQNIFSLAQWHHSLWSCAKISSKLNLFVIPTTLYHSSRLKGVSPLWWSKTMYSICRRYNCYHWRLCMGDDPWLTDFDQHLTKIVRYTVSGGASSLSGWHFAIFSYSWQSASMPSHICRLLACPCSDCRP